MAARLGPVLGYPAEAPPASRIPFLSMGSRIRRGLGHAWVLALGDVDRIERLPLPQRSRFQQARLDTADWGKDGGWPFALLTAAGPLLVGGLVGLASDRWLSAVGAVFVSALSLYGIALIVFAWRAPAKALIVVHEEAASLRESRQVLLEQAPKLTLGPVLLPEHSSRYLLSDEPHDFISGRVLLVPVSVSRGTENAAAVRASLNFLPDDPTGSFSPRNPFFAEWAVDDGSLPTTVEIPSNGLPMHFCLAFVADDGHPAVFAWTKESRASRLAPRAFGIAAHPAEIHVEVSGSGHGAAAPFAEDTLLITMYNGMLNADWASADPEDHHPGVPRPHRSLFPRSGNG